MSFNTPVSGGRVKILKLRLDDHDHESITEALAIRRSGLFRRDGELILPEGESDETGALVAEFCRDWTRRVTADVVNRARGDGT